MANKELKLYAVILSVILIVMALVLPLLRFFHYEFIHYFMLYDYIQYNGILYYFTDVSPDLDIDFNTKVSVHLVDKNKKVFDSFFEKAYVYIGDDNVTYLYFDSKVWCNDMSAASQYYK